MGVSTGCRCCQFRGRVSGTGPRRFPLPLLPREASIGLQAHQLSAPYLHGQAALHAGVDGAEGLHGGWRCGKQRSE